MIQQHNIDRNDAAFNTRAPFEYACQLALPGGTIPSMAFRSIVVYCNDGTRPPARLTAAYMESTATDHVNIEFGDSAGSVIGVAKLYLSMASNYVTTFIFSPLGVLKGHVCYNAQAAELLRDAAVSDGGRYKTGDADFILLPQCHVAWLAGHCRAISVNGNVTLADVVINPTIEMHTSLAVAVANIEYADTSYVLGMAEPYVIPTSFDDGAMFNGICKLKVNNLDSIDMSQAPSDTYMLSNPVWLGGVNLTLRSSDTSNIRVITSERSVKLDGVQE